MVEVSLSAKVPKRPAQREVIMRLRMLSLLAFVLSSPLIGSLPYDEPMIPDEDQSKVSEYIKDNRESWLDQDQPVMLSAPLRPGENGWGLRQDKIKKSIRLRIYQKKTTDSGDTTFYYWDRNAIDVPLRVATEMFSSWVELAENWLSIIKFSKKLMTTPDGHDVWYQYFDPPVGSVRTIVSTCVTRVLDDTRVLISCRSLPSELTRVKTSDAIEIRWRVAYLLTADKERTLVQKIDEENEGGWVCPYVLNLAMPNYLNEEVPKTVQYVRTHRDELITRAQ